MNRFSKFVLPTVAILIVASLATPAFAIFPKLSTKLTCTPINGVTAAGDAKVDQSKYPKVPAQVSIKMTNVNLPDGSVLFVSIDGEFIGNVTVNRKAVNATISQPGLQVGGGSYLRIVYADQLIATGGARWQS